MDEDTFPTPEMMNKEGSTGKKKSKEKEIPRYLRASTGSCHDFCKYGRKNISLEKPWRSTPKKIFKRAPADDLKETLKPASSKTRNVTQVKNSDHSSEIIIREVSGVSSGNEMKKKSLTSKLKASPDPGSPSSALKQKVLTKSYSALATPKSKANHGQLASSPLLNPKMRLKSGGKDEDAKINKAAASSRVASKKVPVTPRASLSPRLPVRLAGNSSLRKSQSLKAASSRPNQKPRHVNRTDESNVELDGYPVEEKTLHVVEPFPPLPLTLSTQKDDECSVSEEEEYEYPSGSNEAESAGEETGMSNGEKIQRARKEGDSPDDDAHKLHFRRGKVVDADTLGESARKLKFRRGRGLGEDKEEDTQGRRSFNKREDTREEDEEDGEKVVLRHQDVQEKDAQGLFNNVIEETASKLVEARKSKVKALVGAFETVISLQESKPPANSETVNLD